MKSPTLYLIPVPISDNLGLSEVLVQKDITIVKELKYFVTETPKTARAFLKDIPLTSKIQDIDIQRLDKSTEDKDLKSLLDPLSKGNDMGLISDSGSPSIADPGYRLVHIAQLNNIKVVPLIGPSSIFLALMASGLNGQSFTFHGYLPKEKGRKRKRIKTLERISLSTKQTQIFMETPYKNQHMFDDILDVCEDTTFLCVAQDVMGENEHIVTKRIKEWKNERKTLDKTPCLFLINI